MSRGPDFLMQNNELVKLVPPNARFGKHGRQRSSDIGGGVLRFLHFFLLPLPSLLPLPFNLARGFGERCKLPQRVRAEPGHQTNFGAFRGKSEAFGGGGAYFLFFLTDRT